MGLEQEKVIQILRLSILCLTCYLITWYYQVPEREWCLITVGIVMMDNANFGAVFKKSALRFLGTSASALYGLFVVYFGDNNVIINMTALVCGMFVYSYYFSDSEYAYIGIIGSVTLFIVLLSNSPISFAVLRVFNIIIGITASMLMMRYFYPRYAKDQVMETLQVSLEYLSDIIINYLDLSNSMEEARANYTKNETTILKCFTKFNQRVLESKLETEQSPQFASKSLETMQHIRYLFRLFSVFLVYMSSEGLRHDPYVSSQLNALLANLQAIQNNQISPDLGDTLTAKPTSFLNKQDTILTHFIEEMNNELAAIRIKLTETRLIYDNL